MIFNSVEYALFLPIVFVLYWFVFNRNTRLQNFFVVAVSYLFYGWWDWRFLFLIAFTSLCSWTCGLLIDRFREKAGLLSAANVCINLAVLALFKYYDFFVSSFADVFLGGNTEGLLLHLVLPVGISFYTFQALSYTIDVYKGRLAAVRDPVQFFAYVSFFPQLVAGPIERATNLLPQFGRKREFDCGEAFSGVTLIMWGLFKKMVLADNCARYVDVIFSDIPSYSGSTLLLAAVLFAFQIYGDFSGYSDIAIGTAKLFGIRLMRNFNVPYFSRDIAEFWRRWHISLTTWFRDYVYIPMGGSRCSKARVVLNTFVIFLLSGLWHGADWTFLAWGGYHAILFMPLILTGKNRRYRDVVAEERHLPSFRESVQIIVTFLLAVLGWIIFRADSIGQAALCFSGIFSRSLLSFPVLMKSSGLLPAAFALVAVTVVEWVNRREPQSICLHSHGPVRTASVWILLAAAILLFGASSESFIYFQF